MVAFKVDKGGSFAIAKAISVINAGLGWDVPQSGPTFDLDVHMLALVHVGGDSNRPRHYNDGDHALTYAAKDALRKNGDGSFETPDGSMWHRGDNRTGRGDGYDEEVKVFLEKLPADIVELAVWVTIYDAAKKAQDFGSVKNAFIEVKDGATGQELCRYSLTNEFAGKTSIQVASFLKGADGAWKFHAIGAGSTADLGQILENYG